MKKTPLNEEHKKLNAKMVEFAGWEMPIQYEGVTPEHLNVRKNVGLFDVSHMGEVFVRGPKALETLQWLTTNDVEKLNDGDAQYSLFPNENGGIVDDLIVYCLKKNEEYLLCVNAANIEKDFAYLQENNKGAELTNESDQWAQIAIQGPQAVKLTSEVLGQDYSDIPSFKFSHVNYKEQKCILARTGYTGEDGFEIFLPNKIAAEFWSELLEKGQKYEVKPIGLAARDTLRTEMKYPLYGHEINDETNPYEARLGWVVKPKAKDFLGKDKMLAVKESGLKKQLVAFKLTERGIPREGYKLVDGQKAETGFVTSGTMSPSLNQGFGVGYIDADKASEGAEIFVDIRGRSVRAEIVKAALTKTT